MDEERKQPDLKDEPSGSDFTEADESLTDYDVADDFTDFEELGFLPPAAAPKQKYSFQESVKNFSYPRWLKSVLPPYFKPALWMTALFFAMTAAGYVAGSYDPEIFDFLFSSFDFPDGSSFETFLYIFFNNAGVLFMLIFFGFILSILPVLIIISNGFLIGVVSEATIRQLGLPFLLTGLLPHGIIELPMILLGAGIGFRLGALFARLLFNIIRGDSDACCLMVYQFKKEFLNAAGLYFLFILPLLLVAAIIEVYVTGTLLSTFF
ncbi:MAG: stage II sporulation protein M [Methanimicrococcus sp.]|nr:stage II sporulation protein M [Methanimicrococcus sp.]